MKKFYMTLVAMLCGAAAWAQTCVISGDDVTAVADGKTVSTFKFYMDESDNGSVTMAGVGLVLFEGINLMYYDADEEDNVYYGFSSPMSKSGHSVKMVQGEDNPNNWLFVSESTKTSYKTSTNVLAEINFAVDPSVADGDYDIPCTPQFANNGKSVFPQEPFTIKLTVSGGTAINSINADEANAPMYNLAGQRVSKAQKGVFVQKGKKVAVK